MSPPGAKGGGGRRRGPAGESCPPPARGIDGHSEVTSQAGAPCWCPPGAIVTRRQHLNHSLKEDPAAVRPHGGPRRSLRRLQQKLIDAVAPFTVETGTAAAFVTTPEAPDINQPTIDYIAAFVPQATGKDFNPHVTVGIASQDYLKQMLAEPFAGFTFSPAGASVYQLGNFGTAQKKLKTWELKP